MAIRSTRAEVDLGAIVSNLEAVARVAGVDAYAVIKADAYGHGVTPVARSLVESPRVTGLAVALVEEGVELRESGIVAPILMMGAAIGDAHAEIVAHGMVPMISRLGDLRRFCAIGADRGTPVPVHLKVDTGMRRLGIAAADLAEALSLAGRGVTIEGLCTHLACADVDDPADPESLTVRQLRLFGRVLEQAAAAGVRPSLVHAANSAGALLFPAAAFTHVRPGLAIYGNGPRPAGVALAPALRLVSDIVQIRPVAAGDSVSYGARWTAERPSRIAVVPLGYADGYSRLLSNKGEVLVGGRRCPVAGTVCMDMILVDVTALGDDVAEGDEVVVLGGQGGDCISAAELAAHTGLSEYEVTCGISKRVPRVYTTTSS